MTEASTHAAIIRAEQGNLIQNPIVGVANTARREMQRLAAEFGLPFCPHTARRKPLARRSDRAEVRSPNKK